MVATLAVACCAACSGSGRQDRVYGAQTARLGESLAVLGWNRSMSNLRWQDNYVLVDVDAGALAHPMAATGIGSCDNVRNLKNSTVRRC